VVVRKTSSSPARAAQVALGYREVGQRAGTGAARGGGGAPSPRRKPPRRRALVGSLCLAPRTPAASGGGGRHQGDGEGQGREGRAGLPRCAAGATHGGDQRPCRAAQGGEGAVSSQILMPETSEKWAP
jgi:hypothetical protein